VCANADAAISTKARLTMNTLRLGKVISLLLLKREKRPVGNAAKYCTFPAGCCQIAKFLLRSGLSLGVSRSTGEGIQTFDSAHTELWIRRVIRRPRRDYGNVGMRSRHRRALVMFSTAAAVCAARDAAAR